MMEPPLTARPAVFSVPLASPRAISVSSAEATESILLSVLANQASTMMGSTILVR